MFYINKSIVLIKFLIVFNKIIINVSLETILGDECICEGRCKECVIAETHKMCKLLSAFYGSDAPAFKNLGIDSIEPNELQVPRRASVCPSDFRRLTPDNRTTNEIIFVKLECGVTPVDNSFCVGINPQLFLIGSTFAEYWIIIGSILSIVFILCCALYSLFKNNWCFSSENLIHIYGQNFPLSTINQSRVNSINSFHFNDTTNHISVEMRSDSSHPPTYDEVFTDCSNNQNYNTNSSDKRLVPLTKSESNDVLPSYEDAIKVSRTVPKSKAI